MRSKIFYLLVIIVFPSVVFGQMRSRFILTDAERYGLNGRVSEVEKYFFEPHFTSDSTYDLEYGGLIFPQSFKYIFNDKGFIKMIEEYKPSCDTLKLKGIWNYSYDKENRITKEQWILIGYNDIRDTSSWNYEYVGDSITYIKKFYRSFGKKRVQYYSYYQKGNNEIYTHANSDSSYISKKLFVYDRKNRKVRFEDYGNKDFVQDLRIYAYKDTLTRNVYKEVCVWTKYNDNFYNRYEYDENQNVVKRIKGYFNKDSTYENRYEYIYDEYGNWIEKKHYGWRGRLVDVYKRKIKYFE